MCLVWDKKRKQYCNPPHPVRIINMTCTQWLLELYNNDSRTPNNYNVSWSVTTTESSGNTCRMSTPIRLQAQRSGASFYYVIFQKTLVCLWRYSIPVLHHPWRRATLTFVQLTFCNKSAPIFTLRWHVRLRGVFTVMLSDADKQPEPGVLLLQYCRNGSAHFLKPTSQIIWQATLYNDII